MLKSGTTQQLGQPLMLETNLPLADVDTAGVHFDIKVDTIWQPLEFKLRPDSLNPFNVTKLRSKMSSFIIGRG